MTNNGTGELGNSQPWFSELRHCEGRIRSDIAFIRGSIDVLIWVVGVNTVATIAILGILLRR